MFRPIGGHFSRKTVSTVKTGPTRSQRDIAVYRRLRSRDRRKLEELCSRETRHPVVFAWQTQFACVSHGILPCSLKTEPGSAEARGGFGFFDLLGNALP
jgi:hypothetical protein